MVMPNERKEDLRWKPEYEALGMGLEVWSRLGTASRQQWHRQQEEAEKLMTAPLEEMDEYQRTWALFARVAQTNQKTKQTMQDIVGGAGWWTSAPGISLAVGFAGEKTDEYRLSQDTLRRGLELQDKLLDDILRMEEAAAAEAIAATEAVPDYSTLMEGGEQPEYVTITGEGLPEAGVTLATADLPEGVSIEDVAKALVEGRRPKPVPMIGYSAEEIFEMLRTAHPPTLPPGIEEVTDVYDILRDLGFEDEDIQASMTEIQSQMEDPSRRLEEIRGFVTEWKESGAKMLKEPGIWTKVWHYGVMSPFYSIGRALMPYFEKVSMPIAGHLYLGLANIIPGDHEIQRLYSMAKDEGYSTWEGASLAFREWKEPIPGWWFWKHIVMESLTDPLMYIGLPVSGPASVAAKTTARTALLATKAAGKGMAAKLARAELKTLAAQQTYFYGRMTSRVPVLGKMVGAAEAGFIGAANIPFRAFKTAWKKIPPMPPMVARRAAETGAGRWMASLQQVIRKPLRQISGPEATLASTEGIDLIRAFPQAAGDWALSLKAVMAAHTPVIAEAEVQQWAARLGVKKIEAVSAQTLDNIQHVLENTWGAVEATLYTPELAASKVLEIIGAQSTDVNINLMMKLLAARNDRAAKLAKATFTGGGVGDIAKRMYRTIWDDTEVKLASPVYAQRHRIGAMSAALAKLEPHILNQLRRKIDKSVTMPVAASMLLFPALGPYNVLEAFYKGGLEGGGWRVKVGAENVRLMNDLWGHLPNLSYFYRTAEPLTSLELTQLADRATVKMETLATMEGQRGFAYKFLVPEMLGEMPLIGRVLNKVPWAGKYIVKFPVRKALIDPFNKYSTNIYARANRNWMIRELWMQAPDTVSEVAKLVDRMTPPASLGKMPRYLELELQDAVFQHLLTGRPEIVRNIRESFTASRLARSELQKQFAAYTNIPQGLKDSILSMVESGELFRNGGKLIPQHFDNFKGALAQAHLMSSEARALQYRHMAELITERGVASYDDLVEALRTLELLNASYDPIVFNIQNLAREEGHKVTDLMARQKLHETVDTGVVRYLEEAQASMLEIRGKILEGLERTGLDAEAMTKVTRALESMEADWVAVTAARDKQLLQHRLMQAETPIAKRGPEFWEKWYALDKEAWEGILPFQRSQRMVSESLIEDVTGAARRYPAPIDTSGRLITISDHAALFATTPDNLRVGLFSLEEGATFLPKGQFVIATQARADRVCKAAGLADAMEAGRVIPAYEKLGWSVERIEAVYDELLRSMKIDPTGGVPILAPQYMELEGMKDVVSRTFRTHQLPADMEAELARYLDDILGEAGKIPNFMTSEVAIDLGPLWEARAIHEAHLRTAKPIGGEMFQKWAIEKKDIVIEAVRTGENLPKAINYVKSMKKSHDDIILRLNRGEVMPASYAGGMAWETKWSKYYGKLVGELEVLRKVPPPKVPPVVAAKAIGPTDEYLQAQIRAMDEVRKTHSRVFADYEAANISAIDDFAKSIYPFWHYEIHRPFWLMTNMMAKPHVTLTLGRWSNNTDRGYVHIPGTDVEINPFRGTIFGPLLTRLTMADYPEYYDMWPGYSQMLDVTGRMGFFPGAPFQLLHTIYGYQSTRMQPAWGQLIPTWWKPGVNASLFLLGQIDSDLAKAFREHVVPDYFRDYMISLAVTNRGYDGSLIYAKKLEGIELTEEEEGVWEKAARDDIALFNLYSEQLSLLRFRPEEMNEAREIVMQLIEEEYGITVEQQRDAFILGIRLSDYYVPFSPEFSRKLREMEDISKWWGRTMPLKPTEMQNELAKRLLFWDTVTRHTDELRVDEAETNRRFLAGEISPGQWRAELRRIGEDRGTFIDKLKESPHYKDIPVTLAEIIADYEERGETVPMFHPIREMINLYYEIEPEEYFDEETETWQTDWAKYYGLIYAVVNAPSLTDEGKAELWSEITHNWTDLGHVRYTVYNQYIRPYQNRQYLALKLFDTEEQKLIEEWYRVARINRERRLELEAVVRADGTGLISSFRKAKTTMGVNIRLLDPVLDAWLYFMGETTTFKSGEELYYKLCTQYGKTP